MRVVVRKEGGKKICGRVDRTGGLSEARTFALKVVSESEM